MHNEITELENQLANAADLSDKVMIRIRLAKEYKYKDISRAIAICEDAIDLATVSTIDAPGFIEGAAEGHYTLGNLYLQASEYNKAFYHFSRAVDAYENLNKPVDRAKVMNSMGAVHYYLGGYVEALDYYIKAMTVFHDEEQYVDEAAVLNNIGLIHLAANEVLLGLDYLERSLKICEDKGLIETKAEALDNISNAYLKLGDLDSALDFGQQSINLFEHSGELQGQSEAYNSLGDVYLAQGDLSAALDHYHKSLDISKSIGNRFEMVRALQKIGETHRLRQKPEQVISVLHQALVIASEIEARQLQFECHLSLAETYKQLGDYETALAHHQEYSVLKEAVFNQEADQRLKQLEIAHQVETARKEAEIYQLRYGDLQKEIVTREHLIDDLNAFAHMVAHDLKNPLQNLNLSVHYLTKVLKNNDQNALEAVRAITQTGEKMNRIVDELLLMASVRQEDIVPEVLDMYKIIQEAITRISSMIEEYNATIELQQDWPAALGYAGYLRTGLWQGYQRHIHA